MLVIYLLCFLKRGNVQIVSVSMLNQNIIFYLNKKKELRDSNTTICKQTEAQALNVYSERISEKKF